MISYREEETLAISANILMQNLKANIGIKGEKKTSGLKKYSWYRSRNIVMGIKSRRFNV